MALPIDWEAIGWLWSLDGYPSDPAHAQFDGKSLRGMRLWKVGGGAYDPARRRRRRAAPGGTSSSPPSPARLRELRRSQRPPRPARLRDRHRAARPLVVGGAGGWLRSGAGGPPGRRRAPVTVPQALAEHEPVERALAASTWGEEKDFCTWDSPPVADLAWGARRLELRLLRALSRAGKRPARG